MTKANRFTLERVQLAAVCVAVFILPLFLWPGTTDYNYAKSIAGLVSISLLLVLWGVSAWRRPTWALRIPWVMLPLLGLVLAGLLSLLHAVNGRVVAQSLILLVNFVLLSLLIANVARTRRDVRWVLAALLISGTLAAAYGVLQYLGAVPGPPGTTGVSAIVSTMGNRNHLGGFLLYLLYPSAILFLRARRIWSKVLVGAAIGLSFFTMLLVQQAATRLVFASITSALVVGWIVVQTARPVLRARRWWIVSVVGILALAGFIVLAFVPARLLGLPNPNGDRSWLVDQWERNSGRTREWDWWIGLDMFTDHPLTGTGLGHYKLEFIASKGDFLMTPRGESYDFPKAQAAQAHNEYVQIAAEMGSLGLVALIAVLGTLGISLGTRLARAHEEGRIELLLLAAGILAFLAHSVLSFPAHVVASSLAFVSLCGLSLSSAYGDFMSTTLRLRRWHGRAIHLALVACALSVSLVAAADLRANVLMEQGISQVQAGLYVSGELTLQRSLRLDFAPRQTYYYLAVAQIHLDKLDQAEENLRKCMTRFVDEAALLNYANLLVNTGQSEKAFAPLHLLLASNPRREIEPRARYLHALAVGETGDPAAAIGLIRAILLEFPTYETAYIGLGGLFESLQQWDEARQTYEEGIALIDSLQSRLRQQIDAAGDSAPPQESASRRAQLERLAYERATLSERLRKLPAPDSP
jgi:O-antigen ligase